jgi:hypothetical protein
MEKVGHKASAKRTGFAELEHSPNVRLPIAVWGEFNAWVAGLGFSAAAKLASASYLESHHARSISL